MRLSGPFPGVGFSLRLHRVTNKVRLSRKRTVKTATNRTSSPYAYLEVPDSGHLWLA
jgi:hypothetical protein